MKKIILFSLIILSLPIYADEVKKPEEVFTFDKDKTQVIINLLTQSRQAAQQQFILTNDILTSIQTQKDAQDKKAAQATPKPSKSKD